MTFHVNHLPSMKCQVLFSLKTKKKNKKKKKKKNRLLSAIILLSNLSVNPSTPVDQNIFFFFFANCVESDETAHNEPSHQDLHCLPFCFEILMVTPI